MENKEDKEIIEGLLAHIKSNHLLMQYVCRMIEEITPKDADPILLHRLNSIKENLVSVCEHSNMFLKLGRKLNEK